MQSAYKLIGINQCRLINSVRRLRHFACPSGPLNVHIERTKSIVIHITNNLLNFYVTHNVLSFATVSYTFKLTSIHRLRSA